MLKITLDSNQEVFLRKTDFEGAMFTVYYDGYDQKEREGKPSYFVKAFTSSDFRLEKIRYEKAILEKLDHVGIIKTYNVVDVYEGFLGRLRERKEYFVFEYVDWRTLTSYMKTEESIPLKKKLRIIRELAEVLNYLHTHEKTRGIILHREINPENIMIQDNKENLVKLVDFRNAIENPPYFNRNEKVRSHFTKSKTREYLARERIARRKKIPWMNTKSEVFSLGIIAYELLAGFHPFKNIPLPEASTFDFLFTANQDFYYKLLKGKRSRHYTSLNSILKTEDMPKGLVYLIESSLHHNWKKRPDAKDYLGVKW